MDSINVRVELISMILVKNNSYLFNVTDPQNWTGITVIAENQCRSTRIPFNFNASMHIIYFETFATAKVDH